MVTAVDTSVLLDILLDDPKFAATSLNLLESALIDGRVIACSVVWAELRPLFESDIELIGKLTEMSVEYDEIGREASLIAGQIWKEYRKNGGKKTRVLADFLIGAQALTRADQLLTRDRGYYRTYFKNLTILG